MTSVVCRLIGFDWGSGMLNAIPCGPMPALAASTAARSEPGPLSWPLVTTCVDAAAGGTMTDLSAPPVSPQNSSLGASSRTPDAGAVSVVGPAPTNCHGAPGPNRPISAHCGSPGARNVLSADWPDPFASISAPNE